MISLEEINEPAPTGDLEQVAQRAAQCAPDQPIAIYEVHLPSWMRVPEEGNRSLTFFEIAPKLAEHAKLLHFTHIQLHAPDYVDPKGLHFLVEYLQQRDLGVILETASLASVASGPHEILADGHCANDETHMFDYHYKWDTAWADETCGYFATDPLYRKFRQTQFTHRDVYAFDASYLLPLSEHLVTRPRSSLYGLMPGDSWQKLANLRLLFAYMYLLPGKKLVFMGDEFGQQNPWQPETSLDWHLVSETSPHGKLMKWVACLNQFYHDEPALHQTDADAAGFQWLDTSDAAASVVSFARKSQAGEILLVVLNCTPVPRYNYRVGAPKAGFWSEVLNSDAMEYGGSGQGNLGGVEAAPFGWNYQSHSLMLTLPPLGAVALKAPGQ
jgi:1,4-alpha-glucan branching enzyme